MPDTSPVDYMERASSLARLALGYTSPNPAVGAVIVKDGEVVGEGYTQPPGSDHAEIVALKEAGIKARGATIYVTLEPCSHFGRTPPCTRAIISAGISEVHAAMLDPNPAVNGKGKAELEKAGIKTYLGEHEHEARTLNEAYVKHITTGCPFVIAKFAMSLDGKIATKEGDSKWISGEESRGLVHRLRHTVDAIMVGINTVLTDDPHLTFRAGSGKGGTAKKQPLRVILDSRGRAPVTAQIFHEAGQTLLAVAQPLKPGKAQQLAKAGVEVLTLPGDKGLVDLKRLVAELGKREIASILVEGGGTLLGSLMELGLVDKVVAFVAPIIIGGADAKTAVEGGGISRLSQALHLHQVKVGQIGNDIMICGYIQGGLGCSQAS